MWDRKEGQNRFATTVVTTAPGNNIQYIHTIHETLPKA